MLRCVAVGGGFLLSRANLPVVGRRLSCPVPRGLAPACAHVGSSLCVLAGLRRLKTQQRSVGWAEWSTVASMAQFGCSLRRGKSIWLCHATF